ncbi:uncharacterized protein LOC100177758 [Ciona intestinalis]
MSRQNASKSRAEKGASRGGGGAQSVQAPTITNDVVPGRLSDGDWSRLMYDEEDTSFVGSIVDDIVELTLAECHKRFTWKQVLPFTVYQAKDALLQIVQWRFLSRDLGEENVGNDPGWTEDSEPEPAVIDSWAQGSVPVVVRPQSSSLPSVSMISEEPAFLQGTEPTTTSDEQTDSTGKTGENETTGEKTDEKPLVPEFVPEPPRTLKKKRRSYKVEKPLLYTYDKPVNAHLSPSQKSLLKVQAGRPPGNREVTFDERGNVVGVMRLNTRTLPTHRVRVQYSIIDPEAEANAQRLAAMRTGKIRKFRKPNWKVEESSETTKDSVVVPPPNARRLSMPSAATYRTRDIAMSVHHLPPGSKGFSRSGGVASSVVRERQIKGARIDPLPPSLIDTIDASPGVIIREGGQMKTGPIEQFTSGISKIPNIESEATVQLVGKHQISIRNSRRPTINPKDLMHDNFAVQSPHALPHIRSKQTTSS